MRSLLVILLLGCSVGAWAQTPGTSGSSPANAQVPNDASPKSDTSRIPNLEPPRSDRVNADALGDGESSSKDTLIDLSPPPDDVKTHPESSDILMDEESAPGTPGVGEFHAWNPHKAAKDIEVGDYYFKRKNYRAAEDRYREALFYKDNDALATFHLAVCLEKMDQPDEARKEYESYLRILPHGPQAEEARKAMERLKASAANLKSAQ
jgi:tetratricopeptide (TPR) repeat protein